MLMKTFTIVVAIVALPLAPARSDAADAAPGKQLYAKECMPCHGQNDAASGPFPLLALQQASGGTPSQRAAQLAVLLAPGSSAAALESGLNDTDRVAVALPYGPNLRGVVGRPAGKFKGFQYSKAFLSALKDVSWSESELDAWITDSQARAPDTIMFYKQKDPQVRRQIIEYLKAN
jgi:cytochrome c